MFREKWLLFLGRLMCLLDCQGMLVFKAQFPGRKTKKFAQFGSIIQTWLLAASFPSLNRGNRRSQLVCYINETPVVLKALAMQLFILSK